MNKFLLRMILLTSMIVVAVPTFAQEAASDEATELAKKLANPVASFISVPVLYNKHSK
jgi:hypothetical protein